MVRSYVLSKYMSGTTSDNIELDINQMMVEDRYEIDNPKDVIAEDIYVSVEPYIDPKYTLNKIRSLLDSDGKHKLACYEDEDSGSSVRFVIISTDNEKKTYFYELVGTFKARNVYKVNEIEDASVGYLVSEHIINPEPGCDLIERCYTPIFSDLTRAMQYKRMKMKDYVCEKGAETSGYRITVVNKPEFEKTEWYKLNIQIARDLKNYGLDAEDYRYIKDLNEIRMTVLADAYDDLPTADQNLVNMHIFEAMRPYISEEYLPFLLEDLEEGDAQDIESVADDAIMYALVNAKSEEQFKEIHAKLGPNEYRVGALTDEIYRQHPNEGYIVVTKEGNLGWYPACYGINEWEESKDNPYHGVFQQNWNDTLLSLKEYHPELITDYLPRTAEVDEWEKKYLASQAEVKAKHKEMKTGFDDYIGRPTVTGDWYYDGVMSSKCMRGITYFRDYEDYIFTDRQCRDLLSGKEIIIDDYETKSGDTITIRGKLKDIADVESEDVDIQFFRTDIDPDKRRALNLSMGIDDGMGI